MPKTNTALALALAASLAACTGEGGSESASATSGASTSTSTSTSKGDTSTGSTSSTTTTSGGEETLTEPGTEGGTETTTDGSTSDETGCSFIGCLDGGTSKIECDIWAQDCPEGEKCAPWASDGGSSWNALKCVPVDPNPVQPGEVCNTGGTGGVSGQDNCDKGSMCWNVDYETDEGTCIAHCQGSEMNPICAPHFECAIAGSGLLTLCLPLCYPLIQNCPGGDLCLPISDGWICVLDASGGEGVYGVPCEYANACNLGLLCISAEYVEDCKGPGCCTPFCDIFEPNTCPGATQECIPWYEEGMAKPGYENVGVCGIPQ